MLLALLSANVARAQQPVIKRIYVTDTPTQDSVFQLGNTIALEVPGLSRWLKYQEELLVQQGFERQKAYEKARELVLYIGDAPILGMPPLSITLDETSADSALTAAARLAKQEAGKADRAVVDDTAAAHGDAQPQPVFNPAFGVLLGNTQTGLHDKIVFKLTRNVGNYKYWDIVYKSPWESYCYGQIGLGYGDRTFTILRQPRGGKVRIDLIERGTLWVAILGFIALGLGLLLLGARSWLLRNAAGIGGSILTASPTFSLAKVQLAWWTFVILGSFLVIYCVSGEMPEISTTSLTLLGISSGTAALNSLITGTPAATAPERFETSRGWLTDILSDEKGLSINRLQQAVISLILGYFFFRTVYNSVSMPIWTDNQILLLGISNATYLGVKWQENRANEANGEAAVVARPVADAGDIVS